MKLEREEGEPVRNGERLAELDVRLLRIEIERSEATLAGKEADLRLAEEGYRKEEIAAAKAEHQAAESNLALARLTEARTTKLYRSNAASRQTYDDARANRRTLEQTRDAARANYERLAAGLRPDEVEQKRAARDVAKAELEALRYQLHTASVLVSPGEALIGLRFPSDFARMGEVLLVADARNSTTAGVASGYVASVVARMNGPASASVVERYRLNENGITRYAIVPALVIALALIQVLILSALSVSREREDGSFDMMLMTPATSVEILIGKAVVATGIACLQAFLIFLIGILWFGIPFRGSFLTLGVFVFGFSSSMVGLGLAVSAVAKNIQQSIVWVIFLMLPMIILSGLLTSVRAMPEWMQTLTVFNPLRAAITGLRAIYFEGAGLVDVLPLGWPVALVALLSMGTAVRLFRRHIV